MRRGTKIHGNIFEDLFVLEMASNHWGDVDRGIKIIREYAKIVKANDIKAAIKLQLRDVDSFVHKSYKDRKDIRYIWKTVDTKLTKMEYKILADEIKASGCITMATPFDEASVDFCSEFEIEIMKIASCDIKDLPLLQAVAKTKKPVVISTGGAKLEDIDKVVAYFTEENIPFALNHCVSVYPSEKSDLELNQIDLLKNRYPGLLIGFSTHEIGDLSDSMLVAYAKGARTFERHIDLKIPGDDRDFTLYSSLPHEIDSWFKAYHQAKALCGGDPTERREFPESEVEWLNTYARGAYLKRDLPKGHIIQNEDVYWAIPILKGQFSCREVVEGQCLAKDLKADEPVLLDTLKDALTENPVLRELIANRGMEEN